MSDKPSVFPSGQRNYERISLRLNLLDNLKTVLEGKAVGCISRDISMNGLGIVCFQKLGLEKSFVLKFPSQNKMVLLNVKWCRRDQERPDIFHVGLHLDQLSGNLVELFIRESLITGRHLLKPVDKRKSGPVMTFSQIKKIISVLNLPDQKLLRQIGLDFLKNTHVAFQKRYQEKSHLVILRGDISSKPSDLISPGDAAIKILIFEEALESGQKSWNRIWPDQSLISDMILFKAIRKDLRDDPFVIISGNRDLHDFDIEIDF